MVIPSHRMRISSYHIIIASYHSSIYRQHQYSHFGINVVPCMGCRDVHYVLQTQRLHQPILCILYVIMVTTPKSRTVLNSHGSHHVTQRAMAHICKDIKDHGMVAAASRRTMHRHRTTFANQRHGKLIQELPLTTHKDGCISPPFLHPRLHQPPICLDFKSFFRSVLKGQRLKLAAYTDEI